MVRRNPKHFSPTDRGSRPLGDQIYVDITMGLEPSCLSRPFSWSPHLENHVLSSDVRYEDAKNNKDTVVFQWREMQKLQALHVTGILGSHAR